MKINYYLLTAIFFVISSCVTDPADEITYRTKAAHSMFNVTENMICSKLVLLNVLHNADLYLAADSDDEKYHIEDSLFPGAKMRYLRDTLSICDDRSEILIATSGKLIKDEGTVWKLLEKKYGTMGEYTVSCLSPHYWHLEAQLSARDNSTLQFFENYSLNFNLDNGTYQVSGEGDFSNDKRGNLKYTILSPIHIGKMTNLYYYYYVDYSYLPIDYIFMNGKIDMVVSTNENPKPELISSDLTDSEGKLIKNRITYMGVSEVWSMDVTQQTKK